MCKPWIDERDAARVAYSLREAPDLYLATISLDRWKSLSQKARNSGAKAIKIPSHKAYDVVEVVSDRPLSAGARTVGMAEIVELVEQRPPGGLPNSETAVTREEFVAEWLEEHTDKTADDAHAEFNRQHAPRRLTGVGLVTVAEWDAIQSGDLADLPEPVPSGDPDPVRMTPAAKAADMMGVKQATIVRWVRHGKVDGIKDPEGTIWVSTRDLFTRVRSARMAPNWKPDDVMAAADALELPYQVEGDQVRLNADWEDPRVVGLIAALRDPGHTDNWQQMRWEVEMRQGLLLDAPPDLEEEVA